MQPDPVESAAAAEAALDLRLHPGVLACIAVGGAIGALSRYGVSRVIHVPTAGFPRATYVINCAGSFALGAFLAFVQARRLAARYARPLFALGFCGAFTTFSTMAVETVTLIKDGDAGLGIAYILASVAVGIACCVVGVRAGRLVARSTASELR